MWFCGTKKSQKVMKYDFDLPTQRRGTASVKWDEDDDPQMIPLWVADMDFRTAPAVTEALRKRVDGGIFGYVHVPDSYYSALCRWFSTRHGWDIDPRSVIYTSGVVPALSAIIKALTQPGQGVIVQMPAYNCFFSCVRNNGCQLVPDVLQRVDNADGRFAYRPDWDSLRRAAARPDVHLMILCNPHNPTGRVWTRTELETIRDICHENGVRVVSDEIHCELTRFGTQYVPYATVDAEAVVCCSPSKAFNTAGLQIANIVCPDDDTYRRIDRAINDNEVCDVGPFGVDGLQAAYNHGGEWLDALNEYLDGNYALLCRTFAGRMPQLRVCLSEATYLAWVDITATGMDADALTDLLKSRAHVRVASGSIYGDSRYIRINYATRRELLAEALDRIANIVTTLHNVL